LQQRAVEFVLDARTVALFFKQRLGKSWIALGAIERGSFDYSLLIVPLTNKYTTWRKLIDEKLPGFECLESLTEFLAAKKAGRRKLILLLHYEQMVPIRKKLWKVLWTFACIDEAHRLKDRNSSWSKAAARIQAEYKLILTGTPLEARPQDCWAQFRFLIPDLFGTRWLDFEEEYIEDPSIDLNQIDERTGKPKYPKGSIRWRKALFQLQIGRKKRKFKKEKLAKFIRKIRPYSWREELPSPEPVLNFEWVRLRGEQGRIYRELNRRSVVTVDECKIKTEFEAVKKVKLHQICGGYLIDNGDEVHEVGRAKLRRLLAIVKREGTPVVIFCQFTAEVEAMEECFPDAGTISGKHRKTRDQVQQDFQAGKIDKVICQTRSGGVGIDLYRAKYLIVYSTTHSFIDWDQLIARIRLPEQTEPVNIFLIVAEGTVDEDKYRMISGKNREVGAVLSQLKR
jgi:SWI/SNF-related matrix-associated actin-dependent regulator of chromatin subfamily A member 5